MVFISSLAVSANPVAVVVLAVAASAALVLAVASEFRAAASAAAAAACHACCVCFFVIHNADASSSDIDPYVSGRSPQTSRICSGAYVATDVFLRRGYLRRASARLIHGSRDAPGIWIAVLGRRPMLGLESVKSARAPDTSILRVAAEAGAPWSGSWRRWLGGGHASSRI